VNLVAQVGIVLTGGLVRLTGSGLGCPTWPECVPGSYTPTVEQEEGYHKHIEFGNRLLTFVVTLAAIAALVAVVKHVGGRAPRTADAARRGAFVGVLVQAGLGGVTVLTGLSPGRSRRTSWCRWCSWPGPRCCCCAVRSPSGPAARALGAEGARLGDRRPRRRGDGARAPW
jgi:heme A synthase